MPPPELQHLFEGPHALLTPGSLFPNRLLPYPPYSKHEPSPSLEIHSKCRFRSINIKMKRWGPWRKGLCIGSDYVTLPTGHQMRRYLIRRDIPGRVTQHGEFVPPSFERHWILPVLGQVSCDESQEAPVAFQQVLSLLRSWSVLVPLFTEVPTQGKLYLIPVWYRGEADVFPIIFGDYNDNKENSAGDLPSYPVRLTEGPFCDRTVMTFQAGSATDTFLQFLAETGQVLFRHLLDTGVAPETRPRRGESSATFFAEGLQRQKSESSTWLC